MKKLTIIILMILLTVIPFNNLALGENVSSIVCVAINDDLVYFEEVYPQIKDGLTFVPMRFFVQAMGAEVNWDDKNKTAIIEKDNKVIIVDINKKTVSTNYENSINYEMFLEEDRIMIPFRFITDYFGYKISYIEEANLVRAKDIYSYLSDEELIQTLEVSMKMERERIRLEIENKNKEKEAIKLLERSKIAYVTFDDGPSKYTSEILSILEKYEVKGTFFMLSNNIKKYSEDVNKIIENGNSVGLHGVTHNAKKIYKSPASLVSEMNEGNESLFNAIGFKTNLIRTPYGSKPYMTKPFRDAYVKEGYKMWDWNVDSKDSLKSDISSKEIIENIKEQVPKRKSPIILLHEKKSTVEALPEILYYLKQEGYTLESINYSENPVNFWNDTR